MSTMESSTFFFCFRARLGSRRGNEIAHQFDGDLRSLGHLIVERERVVDRFYRRADQTLNTDGLHLGRPPADAPTRTS